MYDRNNPGKRGQVKELFKIGVEFFLNTVKHNPIVIREGGIRCSCVVCGCDVCAAKMKLRFIYIIKDFNLIIGFGQVMARECRRVLYP
jgi:hypothetical protein